jgi:hypothetical protein
MEFKTLTIEELKKDYSTRHGFIFGGTAPSKDENVDLVCDSLIKSGITNVKAEFIVKFNPNTFLFVYPEDCSFDSPLLYQRAKHFGMITGAWQFDTLSGFLTSN